MLRRAATRALAPPRHRPTLQPRRAALVATPTATSTRMTMSPNLLAAVNQRSPIARGLASSTTSRPERWERNIAALQAYKDAHGSTAVPKGWPEDVGLAAFVREMRRHKKHYDAGKASSRLTTERIAQLEAMDFAWTIMDTWDELFRALCAYSELHGNCNVPQSSQLGRWVTRQRALHANKLLLPERTAQLESIGHCWNIFDAKWAEMFSQLEQYHAMHGHTMVPRTTPHVDGGLDLPKLANWVNQQRKAKRTYDTVPGSRQGPGRDMSVQSCRITPERIAKLEEIGFVWVVRKGKTSK